MSNILKASTEAKNTKKKKKKFKKALMSFKLSHSIIPRVTATSIA